MQTYQRSGVVPAVGGVLNLAVGAGAALIAAILYTYLTVYIPFIYLNFLITLGFGFVIGYACGKGAIWGKVRNTTFVLVATLFAVAVGIYMEWAVTAYIFVPEIGLWAFTPLGVIGMMLALYAEGSWGLVGDSNVTGIFLAIIWLIEFAMITGTALLTSAAVGATRPFCETCDQWTQAEEGIRIFLPGGGDDVWDSVLAGNFESLDRLERAHGTENTYIRVDLDACPTCDQSQFLTIKAIQKTTDDDGKETENESIIGEHLVARREQVDFVRTCGVSQGVGPLGNALGNPSPASSDLPPLKLDVTDDDDDPNPDDFNFGGK